MTTEHVETTEAADREAMEASFNATFDETPPAETPAVVETTSETTPAAQEEVKTEPESTPAPKIDALNDAELGALRGFLGRINELDDLKDGVRKAHGQVGWLKKDLEARLKQLPQSNAGGMRVNRAVLDKLAADFPELGFDKLFEQVAEAPAEKPAPVAPEAKGAEPVDVEKAIEARLQAKAIADLEDAHPDRVQIRQSPEYQTWLKGMPDDERTKFMASWSPTYVSRKLDEFKEWNKKRQANESRLKGAITPRGNARPAPAVISEDQAMKQGFDSVFQT